MGKKILFLTALICLLVSCQKKDFTEKGSEEFKSAEDFDFSFLEGKNLRNLDLENFPNWKEGLEENRFIIEGKEVYDLRFSYSASEETAGKFSIEVFLDGKNIQEIRDENMVVTSCRPIIFDCNFDGYDDLVWMYTFGTGGLWYKAKIWNQKGRFFDDFYDDLVCPQFDSKNEIIYETLVNGVAEREHWYSKIDGQKKDEILYVNYCRQPDGGVSLIVRFDGEDVTSKKLLIPGNYGRLSQEEKSKVTSEYKSLKSEILGRLGK